MSANIESYCKRLTLSSVADNYENMAIDATKTKISYQEYLYKFLQQQILIELIEVSMLRLKKQDFLMWLLWRCLTSLFSQILMRNF